MAGGVAITLVGMEEDEHPLVLVADGETKQVSLVRVQQRDDGGPPTLVVLEVRDYTTPTR